jgi:hypothetical protein
MQLDKSQSTAAKETYPEPNVRPNEVLSESKDGRKRRRLELTAAATNEHRVLVSSPMDIGCGHDFNRSFENADVNHRNLCGTLGTHPVLLLSPTDIGSGHFSNEDLRGRTLPCLG